MQIIIVNTSFLVSRSISHVLIQTEPSIRHFIPHPPLFNDSSNKTKRRVESRLFIGNVSKIRQNVGNFFLTLSYIPAILIYVEAKNPLKYRENESEPQTQPRFICKNKYFTFIYFQKISYLSMSKVNSEQASVASNFRCI